MNIFLLAVITAVFQNGTVTLQWDPNPPAQQVTGYNIYRGTVSGFFPGSPVFASTTATQYMDTNVQQGNTYYYVVTAYNAMLESPPSNQVNVTIPTTPPTTRPTAPTGLTITFTAASLNIDGKKVASGPPFPIVYQLPKQTPPRVIPITVTVSP